MMKRLAIIASGCVLAASLALPASASTLTSDQVNAIISLLQSFGADSATVANVQAALGGTGTPPTANCVNIYRTLTIGSSGSDVSALQNYG